MKELPSHLKYEFLEPEKKKPVIILAALTEVEEQKLLVLLRKYKEEIAWSIEDLKGISDSCHGRVSRINKICFLCSFYCRSQATAA